MQSAEANLAWNPFPFLKLDIIRHDNMGKQRLEFIDRKNRPGLVPNDDGDGLDQASKTSSRSAYHECCPYPKNKCSLDVDAA